MTKEKAKEAVDIINSLISNSGPHGLLPQSPVGDAPAIDTKVIKLSAPPNYTLGDKVGDTDQGRGFQ